MNYNVFSGTLNPTQSINHGFRSFLRCLDLTSKHVTIVTLPTNEHISFTEHAASTLSTQKTALLRFIIATSIATTLVLMALPTRMWANAQRDGRPAEYRWRPLFNAAKFG